MVGTAGTYAWLYDAPLQADIINIPSPLKEGYTFSGWYDTPAPSNSRLPLRRIVYGKTAIQYTLNGFQIINAEQYKSLHFNGKSEYYGAAEPPVRSS